jgi:hypothetical protein
LSSSMDDIRMHEYNASASSALRILPAWRVSKLGGRILSNRHSSDSLILVSTSGQIITSPESAS